jgi:hypothetical protein
VNCLQLLEESYLRKGRIWVSSRRYKTLSLTSLRVDCVPQRVAEVVVIFSFHLEIFTRLSFRLRPDISKVTGHERIQHLYQHMSLKPRHP